MPIALTKEYKLTYVNPRPTPGDPDSPHDILASYLAEQVIAEKTDGSITIVDAHTSVRFWADQASAQAWADLIETTVIGLGRTDSSYTIRDI